MTTQRQLAKMSNRPNRETASERAENTFLKIAIDAHSQHRVKGR